MTFPWNSFPSSFLILILFFDYFPDVLLNVFRHHKRCRCCCLWSWYETTANCIFTAAHNFTCNFNDIFILFIRFEIDISESSSTSFVYNVLPIFNLNNLITNILLSCLTYLTINIKLSIIPLSISANLMILIFTFSWFYYCVEGLSIFSIIQNPSYASSNNEVNFVIITDKVQVSAVNKFVKIVSSEAFCIGAPLSMPLLARY